MNRLINFLIRVGLSSFEARAYSAFIDISSRLYPKDIAEHANIPYPRVYSVMKQLEEKNLISIDRLSNPILYKLKDPSIALSSLLNSYKKKVYEELEELDILKEELVNEINSMHKDKRDDIKFETYYQDKIVYEIIPMLIRRAEREVIIVGSNIFDTINDLVLDLIYKKVMNDVRFRFIIPIDMIELLNSFTTMDIDRFLLLDNIDELLDVRAADLTNIMPFGIFDSKEVGFSIQTRKGRYIVTHITDDKEVVDEFYEMYKLLSRKARKIELIKLLSRDSI